MITRSVIAYLKLETELKRVKAQNKAYSKQLDQIEIKTKPGE
jgi:hypothetical protein